MKKDNNNESSQISTNKALTLSIEPASGNRHKMTAVWSLGLSFFTLESFELIKHNFDQEAKNEFEHKLTENIFNQMEINSLDTDKKREVLEITESAIEELFITP